MIGVESQASRLGGIIVIVGIVLMFVWSILIGLIIGLIGLIAFGGFARGEVGTERASFE